MSNLELFLTLTTHVQYVSWTGLLLKVQNKLAKSFTYALAPGTDTINPVKKKVLVVNVGEIQGDHVVAHKLEPTQNVAQLVAQYRQNKHTKAVVVVNTSNSLILEQDYLEGFDGGNYPVIIVNKSDGREMLELLEAHDEEDVFCDIEAESPVDAPTQLHGHTQAVTEQPRAGAGKAASSQENKKGNYVLIVPVDQFVYYKDSDGLENEVLVLPISKTSYQCRVQILWRRWRHQT